MEDRKALIQELSLDPDPAVPLLIIISRMDQQKGIDLAIEALYQVKDRSLAGRHPGHRRPTAGSELPAFAGGFSGPGQGNFKV